MSGHSHYVTFPFVPGTEGVGHVVKAGKNAEHLLGKRVVVGGLVGFWAEYAISNLIETVEIDDDVPLASAACGFINPFTAIGAVDEVKNQGKKSIVLDGAASALGRMINKLARKQNIPVLNIVRRKDQ